MKYAKLSTTGKHGKIHIVPLHTASTLCGYPVKDFPMTHVDEPNEAICLYCAESYRDLERVHVKLREQETLVPVD